MMVCLRSYGNLVLFHFYQVPCVGVSIGVERIFSILENQIKDSGSKTRINDTQVYVISPQKNFLKDRMEIITELWNAGIKVCN